MEWASPWAFVLVHAFYGISFCMVVHFTIFYTGQHNTWSKRL